MRLRLIPTTWPLAANRVPEMVQEYQKLISASQKMLPQTPAAEASAKKPAGNGK